MTKETVRAQYDGSLFYQLARRTEAEKKAHKRSATPWLQPINFYLLVLAATLTGVILYSSETVLSRYRS